MNNELTTPNKVISREAQDLVSRGMDKDPMARPTLRGMLEHPFVIGTKLVADKGKHMAHASYTRKLHGGGKSVE